MRLIEADAKTLLRRRGLPVPRGRLFGTVEPITGVRGSVAVKAQLLTGARGKAGLVRFADETEATATAASLRARMQAMGAAPHLLIEETVAIAAEYYLAWRIDDVRQAPVLLFGTAGGVEIESGAVRSLVWDPLRPLHPHHLMRFFADAGIAGRVLGPLTRFASELYRLFCAEDAELAEINPLAVTEAGQVIALDAKFLLDDNARDHHGEWSELLSAQLERASATALEVRAADNGFTFVEMDGSVALFAAGAGFGMALVDLLGDAGLPPANFADTSGGSGAETFGAVADVVFARAAAPDVKAVVCFQTMSSASLKAAVDGLLAAFERAPVKKPLVVGFVVSSVSEREMTAAEARALFAARGHHVIGDLDELVPALRRLIPPPQGEGGSAFA
jgi:succinyl-CoA synthetase beta subunit